VKRDVDVEGKGEGDRAVITTVTRAIYELLKIASSDPKTHTTTATHQAGSPPDRRKRGRSCRPPAPPPQSTVPQTGSGSWRRATPARGLLRALGRAMAAAGAAAGLWRQSTRTWFACCLCERAGRGALQRKQRAALVAPHRRSQRAWWDAAAWLVMIDLWCCEDSIFCVCR